MSLLALQGLVKRYGGISALAGAGFTIDKPGIVGLIGPNGAGKTTLFDAVAGDTVLDAGSIHLDGRRVSGLPSHRVAALGVAPEALEEGAYLDLLAAGERAGTGAGAGRAG